MQFTADAWPGLADGSITLTFRTLDPSAGQGRRALPRGRDAARSHRRRSRCSCNDHRGGRAACRRGVTRLRCCAGSAMPTRCGGSNCAASAATTASYGARTTALDDEQLAAIRRPAGSPRPRAARGRASTLRLIERYPGIVSTKLAQHAGMDRPAFKLNVRKLKEMGLTESLDIGYRLSPRGEAVFARRLTACEVDDRLVLQRRHRAAVDLDAHVEHGPLAAALVAAHDDGVDVGDRAGRGDGVVADDAAHVDPRAAGDVGVHDGVGHRRPHRGVDDAPFAVQRQVVAGVPAVVAAVLVVEHGSAVSGAPRRRAAPAPVRRR